MTEAQPVETPVAPATTERRHLALGMGCFTALVLLCAYGYTLAPGITAGDAGELITAAYEFGVPHAPGYPTYIILGWIMSHLPLGPDPAFRLNLFSMLCTIGACLVAYVLLLRRELHPIFASCVALGIGAGPTLWANGIVAEVYGLNLLALAIFWLLLDADLRTGQHRAITWLMAGLTLTTHQTSLLALGCALAVLVRRWSPAEWRQFLPRTIGWILAPNLLYLHALIASQRDTVLAWGHPDALDRWFRFTFLPVGQQVDNTTVGPHLDRLMQLCFGDVWNRIIGFPGAQGEMGLAIVLAIAGIVAVLSRRKVPDPGQLIWAYASLIYPLVFLCFTRPPMPSVAKVDPYYIPVWFTLWLLVPEGYRALLASQADSPTRRHLGPIMKPVLELLLVLGVLITGGQSAMANHRGGDTFVRDSYTAMLTAAPPDAILLCTLDDIFVCWYLQRVEGMRRDVIPVLAYFPESARDQYWVGWIYDDLARDHPELAVPASTAPLQDRLREYVRTHLGKRPILLTFYDPGYLQPLYPPFEFRALGAGWLPQPLAWRAVTPDAEQNAAQLLAIAKFYQRGEGGTAEYRQWGDRYAPSPELGHIAARYMTGLVSTAQLLVQLGEGLIALDLYDRAIAIAPAQLDHYPVAVGLAEAMGQLDRALGLQLAYVAELRIPLEAGSSNPDLLILWIGETIKLARLHGATGQPQAGQALLTEVLRLQPDNIEARQLQQALLNGGSTP